MALREVQLELGTLQLSRTLCLGLGYKLAVLGPICSLFLPTDDSRAALIPPYCSL